MRFSSTVLAWLIACGGAIAAPGVPCAINLDDQMRHSVTEYRDLELSRSIRVGPRVPDEIAWFERYPDAQGDVAAFLAPAQATGETRPRALLLYALVEETLCATLWRSDWTNPISYALPIELYPEGSQAFSSDLAEDIAVFLSATVEESGRANRQPIRRSGGRGAILISVPAGADVAALQRDLTERLLPDEIAAGLEGISKLNIVPVENIGLVPFAMLDPDGDGHPLVETTPVTVLTSIDVVLEGTNYRWGPPAAPVVFGNPDAAGDPEWIFPALPGAEAEARTVAQELGTMAVLGADATAAAVIDAIGPADYIHVAAHGYSDPDEFLDKSFLALTGGRLTAGEVQDLTLDNLPLVVLSACQTGLGGVHTAGIMGLSRAFLIAGASNVVSSLWNVDDEATAFLMADFAKRLETTEPADALRLAQLETRLQWPDPAYWAAFLTMGVSMLGP